MEGTWSTLFDIVVTLITALSFGVLCEKLRQTAILGYLIAGVLIGPAALGWVNSTEVAPIAELGVALLLFTIGLEFSLRDLMRLGRGPFLAGVLQIVLTLVVTAAIAHAVGQTREAALTLGAVVALSSSALCLRVLKDRQELDTLYGKSVLAVLLLQDMALIPLVLMVETLGSARSDVEMLARLGGSLASAAALVAVMFLLFMLVLPRVLDQRAFVQNRDLAIVLAACTCAAAAWSAHAVGLSPALGAFLAGTMLGESKFAHQIQADVVPLRALFVTLFFASIGMLADPGWVAEHWTWVAAALVVVTIGKAGLALMSVAPFVPSLVASAAAALALANIGEFSFVLAQLGRVTGVLDEGLFQLILSTSILTLIVGAFLVPAAPRSARSLCKRVFPARLLAQRERLGHARGQAMAGHVVLVGYGDAGQAAARGLTAQGRPILVLDLNPRFAELAQMHGHAVHVGDATQPYHLGAAHLSAAACLVIAVPDDRSARLIANLARLLDANLPIVARARHHAFVEDILGGGADEVVDEEVEMGRLLADAVFRRARRGTGMSA
jgi:CPA2 family monovalent cation:H+ antiporter-2